MLKLDFLMPTILLVAVAGFARVIERSWFAPGAFFALVWVAQVFLSFVVPEYAVWSGTVWWVFLTCVVVYTGSMIGGIIAQFGTRGRQGSGSSMSLFFKGPRAMMIVCFIGGSLYTVLVQLSGVEISIPGPEGRPPTAYQLFLPFHFAGPLLGGMIFSARSLHTLWAWLAFLPLMPPAVLAILFTGRTAIILPILLWLAGYFAVRGLHSRGRLSLFRQRYIIGGIGVVVLFLLIGLSLDVLRIVRLPELSVREKFSAYSEALSWEALMAVWHRSQPAVFGHLYSFSYYFVDAWDHPPSPNWGSIIVAAPLDFLGFEGQRYPFETFKIQKDRDWNIYTMLRPPIDDFGLWGSLIWWLVIGVVQGWAFEKVRSGKVWPCLLVAWFYVDVALIGGLFFRYNTVILAYAISGVYLFGCTERSGVRKMRMAVTSRSGVTM